MSVAAVAQDVPPAPGGIPARPKFPPKGRAARVHANGGGFVSRTVREGGCLRFIDLRGDKATDLKPIYSKMTPFFEMVIDSVKADKSEGCPMKVAKKALEGKDVIAAVVIANEGADAPSLIVCPEDRMAVINADRLADESDEVFNVRLTKEMWRAVAFVMGGYASDYPCVLKAFTSLGELDGNQVQMTCPPVSGKVAANAERYGAAKVQTAPYVIAVRQGWAPAPTNDIQKAIWDRVKAEKEARKPEGKKAPAEDKPAETASSAK